MPELDADRQRVVVIGGGLAGIATAMTLAKRGVPVTVLEAKRRLGGRAGSFSTSATKPHEGQAESEVDYCQHVAMGCCHGLKTLIRWLDLEQDWEEHKELHFYGQAGDYQRLRALPLLPPPLHLATWLWKWPNLNLKDRFAVARGLLKIQRICNKDDLDRTSAQAWLEANGQTAAAIEHFWSTIIVSALGEETSRVSLQAVCKVLQDGFLKDREAFHLLVPKRSLLDLFHRQGLAALEAAGAEVRLGQRVSGVAKSSSGFDVRGVCAGGARGSEASENHAASAVVLALPWYQLRQFDLSAFPQLQPVVSKANQLSSSPISGVHTWWDRPWMNKPHATIVGRLCQWVFPKPGLSNAAEQEHYYQIVISASRHLPRGTGNEIGELIQADLAAVFPEVRGAKLLRFKVVTDPKSVFSVEPGALQLRAATVSPVPGLFFAGDWTQTGWPATMEGAVLSGFGAGEAVLRQLYGSGNKPQ